MVITLPLLFRRYSRITMMMIVNKFDDLAVSLEKDIKKPRRLAGF